MSQRANIHPEGKCKHALCKCMIAYEDDFCSAFCEQAESSCGNSGCGCGHTMCGTTGQIDDESPFDTTGDRE